MSENKKKKTKENNNYNTYGLTDGHEIIERVFQTLKETNERTERQKK